MRDNNFRLNAPSVPTDCVIASRRPRRSQRGMQGERFSGGNNNLPAPYTPSYRVLPSGAYSLMMGPYFSTDHTIDQIIVSTLL